MSEFSGLLKSERYLLDIESVLHLLVNLPNALLHSNMAFAHGQVAESILTAVTFIV